MNVDGFVASDEDLNLDANVSKITTRAKKVTKPKIATKPKSTTTHKPASKPKPTTTPKITATPKTKPLIATTPTRATKTRAAAKRQITPPSKKSPLAKKTNLSKKNGDSQQQETTSQSENKLTVETVAPLNNQLPELKINADESEAEPRNNVEESDAEPEINVNVSEAEPGNNLNMSAAEPGNNVNQSDAELEINVNQSDLNVSEAEPGYNLNMSAAEPGNNLNVSAAEPGNNLNISEAEPGNNVTQSDAEPRNNVNQSGNSDDCLKSLNDLEKSEPVPETVNNNEPEVITLSSGEESDDEEDDASLYDLLPSGWVHDVQESMVYTDPNGKMGLTGTISLELETCADLELWRKDFEKKHSVKYKREIDNLPSARNDSRKYILRKYWVCDNPASTDCPSYMDANICKMEHTSKLLFQCIMVCNFCHNHPVASLYTEKRILKIKERQLTPDVQDEKQIEIVAVSPVEKVDTEDVPEVLPLDTSAYIITLLDLLPGAFEYDIQASDTVFSSVNQIGFIGKVVVNLVDAMVWRGMFEDKNKLRYAVISNSTHKSSDIKYLQCMSGTLESPCPSYMEFKTRTFCVTPVPCTIKFNFCHNHIIKIPNNQPEEKLVDKFSDLFKLGYQAHTALDIHIQDLLSDTRYPVTVLGDKTLCPDVMWVQKLFQDLSSKRLPVKNEDQKENDESTPSGSNSCSINQIDSKSLNEIFPDGYKYEIKEVKTVLDDNGISLNGMFCVRINNVAKWKTDFDRMHNTVYKQCRIWCQCSVNMVRWHCVQNHNCSSFLELRESLAVRTGKSYSFCIGKFNTSHSHPLRVSPGPLCNDAVKKIIRLFQKGLLPNEALTEYKRNILCSVDYAHLEIKDVLNSKSLCPNILWVERFFHSQSQWKRNDGDDEWIVIDEVDEHDNQVITPPSWLEFMMKNTVETNTEPMESNEKSESNMDVSESYVEVKESNPVTSKRNVVTNESNALPGDSTGTTNTKNPESNTDKMLEWCNIVVALKEVVDDMRERLKRKPELLTDVLKGCEEYKRFKTDDQVALAFRSFGKNM